MLLSYLNHGGDEDIGVKEYFHGDVRSFILSSRISETQSRLGKGVCCLMTRKPSISLKGLSWVSGVGLGGWACRRCKRSNSCRARVSEACSIS